MSTKNPAELRTKQASRQNSIIALQLPQKRDSGHDASATPKPTLTSTQTRSWDALQDHSSVILAASPSRGDYTPYREGRREGYTWDIAQDEKEADQHPRKPSDQEPKGSAWISSDPDWLQGRSGGMIEHEASWPISRKNRHWTGPSFEEGVSRTDTARSSISSSIRRGPRRAMPDIKAFDPQLYGGQTPSNDPPPKPITKAGLSLTFKLPPALKKTGSKDKVTKRTQFSSDKKEKLSNSDPLKEGLKDRRKLNQIEALKLTLPLDMPDLPPRQRSPISDMGGLRDIAPPRPRSPKTPWVRDIPPSWLPSPDTITVPWAIATSSPGAGGNANGHGLLPGSDPIESSAPIDRLAVKATDELKQLNKKRSRRWRWSRRWTSSDTTAPPTPVASERHFSFSRLFKKSVPPIAISDAAPPPIVTASNRAKITAPKSFYRDPIANMPVPPTFIPPGLNRIPTPPMFDQNGEVKGKLADFFFDIPGATQTPRQPIKRSLRGPGGVWDSDALLMSQNTNITPTSSSDEEAPPQATPAPMVIIPPSPWGYMSTNPHLQSSPLPRSAPVLSVVQSNYFRMQLGDDVAPEKELEEEERAKLEWLTPEHLPTSPLCPLHIMYRGPSRDVCVYHGRKKTKAKGYVGVGVGKDDGYGGGGSPVSEKIDVLAQGKRRRLLSLSSS